MKLNDHKLITYHVNKSSGLGGIETLYREIHNLSSEVGFEVVELYHGVSGEEYFKTSDQVESRKISALLSLWPKAYKWVRYLTLALELCRIKSNGKTIFICVDPGALFFIPNFILKKIKVVIIQSNRFDIFFNKMARASLSLKKNHVNKFTVYTDKDKECFTSYYKDIPLHKIEVIPRGCKLKTSGVTKQIGVKLVTVTRIEEAQKNLDAMILIVQSLRDFTLDIYGGGPKNEVAALINKIKDVDNINYCGVATDMYEVYSDKSLFIMTSNYEGFGQTLIEARSQGLPIVAFDTFDALSYIVGHNVNGFKVEPNNIEQFIGCIVKVLTNQDLYNKLSCAAIKESKKTEMVLINSKWRNLLVSLIKE
jgi:glycosyltransferase involved in cell wall biosynthesis